MNENTNLEGPAAAVKPIEVVEQTLYEIRKKIYPRAVTGKFATARWSFVLLTQLVFYGTPWLTWNERQAVLFDLASRKFYILGLVFWPQDIVYLTALLIIAAYSLFLFTAVAGRLWCGYACPQTVYTELFMWIERQVEGDRMARMKLDAQPLTAREVRAPCPVAQPRAPRSGSLSWARAMRARFLSMSAWRCSTDARERRPSGGVLVT